jgi:hypothetical protein
MKKKLDLNQLAKSVVEQATGEADKKQPPQKQPVGKSGGLARAASLSKEEHLEQSKKNNKIKTEKQALISAAAKKPRIKV